VAGSSEHSVEPSSSGITDLVTYNLVSYLVSLFVYII
jgi:hypothetical protein